MASESTPGARRKQLIIGLVVGALVGVGISLWTGFWLWLAADPARAFEFGLARLIDGIEAYVAERGLEARAG